MAAVPKRPNWLGRADTDDISQTVWLRLVTELGQVRDPAALAGWIATTTRRECGKAHRAASSFPTAWQELGTGDISDPDAQSAESQLLAAERRAALRRAFTGLQLLALLTEDPLPYAQITARLGVPVGSIGPACQRCLQSYATIQPSPP